MNNKNTCSLSLLGKSLLCLMLSNLLIACSGSGSGGPTDYANSTRVIGVANKGIISNASVELYDISNVRKVSFNNLSSFPLLGSTSTDNKGSYDLGLDASFEGIILAKLTATPSTMITCDIASCGSARLGDEDLNSNGTIDFGEKYTAGAEFTLYSISYVDISSKSVNVPLTPLTTLSALYASTYSQNKNTTISQMQLSNANRFVMQAFGLDNTPTSIQTVDLTSSTFATSSELRHSIIDAAFLAHLGRDGVDSLTSHSPINSNALDRISYTFLAGVFNSAIAVSEAVKQKNTQLSDKANTLNIALKGKNDRWSKILADLSHCPDVIDTALNERSCAILGQHPNFNTQPETENPEEPSEPQDPDNNEDSGDENSGGTPSNPETDEGESDNNNDSNNPNTGEENTGDDHDNNGNTPDTPEPDEGGSDNSNDSDNPNTGEEDTEDDQKNDLPEETLSNLEKAKSLVSSTNDLIAQLKTIEGGIYPSNFLQQLGKSLLADMSVSVGDLNQIATPIIEAVGELLWVLLTQREQLLDHNIALADNLTDVINNNTQHAYLDGHFSRNGNVWSLSNIVIDYGHNNCISTNNLLSIELDDDKRLVQTTNIEQGKQILTIKALHFEVEACGDYRASGELNLNNAIVTADFASSMSNSGSGILEPIETSFAQLKDAMVVKSLNFDATNASIIANREGLLSSFNGAIAVNFLTSPIMQKLVHASAASTLLTELQASTPISPASLIFSGLLPIPSDISLNGEFKNPELTLTAGLDLTVDNIQRADFGLPDFTKLEHLGEQRNDLAEYYYVPEDNRYMITYKYPNEQPVTYSFGIDYIQQGQYEFAINRVEQHRGGLHYVPIEEFTNSAFRFLPSLSYEYVAIDVDCEQPHDGENTFGCYKKVRLNELSYQKLLLLILGSHSVSEYARSYICSKDSFYSFCDTNKVYYPKNDCYSEYERSVALADYERELELELELEDLWKEPLWDDFLWIHDQLWNIWQWQEEEQKWLPIDRTDELPNKDTGGFSWSSSNQRWEWYEDTSFCDSQRLIRKDVIQTVLLLDSPFYYKFDDLIFSSARSIPLNDLLLNLIGFPAKSKTNTIIDALGMNIDTGYYSSMPFFMLISDQQFIASLPEATQTKYKQCEHISNYYNSPEAAECRDLSERVEHLRYVWLRENYPILFAPDDYATKAAPKPLPMYLTLPNMASENHDTWQTTASFYVDDLKFLKNLPTTDVRLVLHNSDMDVQHLELSLAWPDLSLLRLNLAADFDEQGQLINAVIDDGDGTLFNIVFQGNPSASISKDGTEYGTIGIERGIPVIRWIDGTISTLNF